MDVMDCISNRHSYRGEYLSERVPKEDLKQIMEAGLAAPSGCNMQTTSLLPVGKAASEPVPPIKKEFGERAWFNGFGG